MGLLRGTYNKVSSFLNFSVVGYFFGISSIVYMYLVILGDSDYSLKVAL